MLSRVHFVARILLLAGLCGVLTTSAQAGSENFANFPETENGYVDGTFTGQDGSTWSYVSCQGSKVIDAPTPGMGKGKIPAAQIESGTISGGCGILRFEYKQLYTATSAVDVVVNDTVRYTVTSTAQHVTNQTGDLEINVGGNFTLKLSQNHSGAGQVAIDNIEWDPYGGADPEPPELLFVPNTNSILSEYSSLIELEVTATEPNVDTVRLWATGAQRRHRPPLGNGPARRSDLQRQYRPHAAGQHLFLDPCRSPDRQL